MRTIIVYVIPPAGESHSSPSDPRLCWLPRPRLSSHLLPHWLQSGSLPTVSPLRTLFPRETFLWAKSLEHISLGVWCPTGAQNTFTILWVMIRVRVRVRVRWGTQSNAAVVMLSICVLQTTHRERVARENRSAQFSVGPGLFVSFIPRSSLLYQSNTHLSSS